MTYVRNNITSIFPFVFTVLLIWVPDVSAAVITFSDDGTFATSDWHFAIDESGTLYPSYTINGLNGGNPGSYLALKGVLSGEAGGYSGLTALDLSFYDPSLQGGINSIDMSVDVINKFAHPFLPNSFGIVGFAVFQDSDMFILPYNMMAEISDAWTTYSMVGLNAGAFENYYGQNPDFSSSGGVMVFSLLLKLHG